MSVSNGVYKEAFFNANEKIVSLSVADSGHGVTLFALTNTGRVLLNDNPFYGTTEPNWGEVNLPETETVGSSFELVD
jgi:hypothetical protein